MRCACGDRSCVLTLPLVRVKINYKRKKRVMYGMMQTHVRCRMCKRNLFTLVTNFGVIPTLRGRIYIMITPYVHAPRKISFEAEKTSALKSRDRSSARRVSPVSRRDVERREREVAWPVAVAGGAAARTIQCAATSCSLVCICDLRALRTTGESGV